MAGTTQTVDKSGPQREAAPIGEPVTAKLREAAAGNEVRGEARSDAFIPSREEYHRQLGIATAVGEAIRKGEPETIKVGLRELVSKGHIDLAVAGVSSGLGSTASNAAKAAAVEAFASELQKANIPEDEIMSIMGRVAEGAVHRYFDYPVTVGHRKAVEDIIRICYRKDTFPPEVEAQVSELLNKEANTRLGVLTDSRNPLDAQQREAEIRELGRQYGLNSTALSASVDRVQNKKELTAEQKAAIKNAAADLADHAGRKPDVEVRDQVVSRLKSQALISRNQVVHGISEHEKTVTKEAIVSVTDYKPDASTEQGRMEIHNRYLRSVQVARAMKLDKDPETRRLIDERDRPAAIVMEAYATAELNKTMKARQEVRDILAEGMKQKKYGTEEGCREVYQALAKTGLARDKVQEEVRTFIMGRLERIAGNNDAAVLTRTLDISDRLMRISNLHRDPSLGQRIKVLQTKLDYLGGPPGIEDAFSV